MKNLKQAPIKGKIVFLRADFNVTINSYGKIIDDLKIRAVLPTIQYFIKNQAKRIIITSHMGRPIVMSNDGIPNIIRGNQGLVLKPIAQILAKYLKIKKAKLDLIYEKDFSLPFYQLSDEIWLMENLRFDKREEKNDRLFSKQMAHLAQIYVDDAFGNAHRKHASNVGITEFLPSYAGFLIQSEIENLGKLLKKPEKPFVLILGGDKVDEKIKILKKLLKKASKILLGGVMANTFLVSRNIDMKCSKYSKDCVDYADDLYLEAAGKFYLPIDLVWRKDMAVDIGKTTTAQYEKIISKAKTIFWNGTMGLTSLGNFKYAIGTKAIISAIANSNAQDKIICGGDTIAEVDKMHLTKRMSHLSTGGGAALAFLAGEKMPGIEALDKK